MNMTVNENVYMRSLDRSFDGLHQQLDQMGLDSAASLIRENY